MNDEELIARLRDWPYQGETMAGEAADRIEALVKERDQWIEHTKNAVWSDSEELKLANDRIKGLEAALREIESISVHSGGEVHGVTADHWKMAFEQAQDVARAALPAVTVGVKLLVWEGPRKLDEGGIAYDAHTTCGHYIATDAGWFLVGQSGWFVAKSLDAAKAAAQADYEARILAALEPQPAPDAAAIREAALKLVQIYDSAMDDLLGEDVHRTHPDSDEMAEIRRVLGAPALLTEKPHDRA